MEYLARMPTQDDRPQTGWAERDDHKQFDVREGEYIPPEQTQGEKNAKTARGIGAAAAGIGIFLAKFKGLLLLLLQFKWAFALVKLLMAGGSFFITLWFYSLFFGWKFALIFVLMIAAHEMGHYVAIRNYGLPAKLPMFLPFVAYTMGGIPESLESDAYIALAGPMTGLCIAAMCYGFGMQTHESLWMAAAYLGAFMNLFNMLPVLPFDGGRVAGALSPSLWVIGFALFVALSLLAHISLFFVVIFALFALPSAIAGFRGYKDPRYATMTTAGRIRVAFWYTLTLCALVYVMTISHVTVPGYAGGTSSI